MELMLIAKLVLIGIMLFSGLSYMFTRSSNKQNLEQAIKENNTFRQLTDDELALLQPYLSDKNLVKPAKLQTSLVSNDVSVLSGSCVRHSLTTNGAESSYYYAISDIEVIFPYGMESYTMADNIVEVVFTAKYAIAVSINGFTLQLAKEERDLEALRNEQWEQGSRGEFKVVSDEELEKIKQDASPEYLAKVEEIIQQNSNTRCEILEQRDETPIENKRLSRLNTGFISALFFTAATIMVLCYEYELWLLIGCGICLVLSLIFYFTKIKLATRRVNRVRGTIGEKSTTTKELLVGDSLLVVYPKYWETVLPENTTVQMDMDVCVGNRELLRYGHTLSIAKEIETYGAPRFWGRNCFLFIVGLVLSATFFLAATSSLKEDLFFSYKWLSGTSNHISVSSLEDFSSADIHVGDTIDVNLEGASCDVDMPYHCKHIFITSEPTTELLDVIKEQPEWLMNISKSNLIKYTKDQRTDLLQMYANLLGYNTNSYNKQKSYAYITNNSELAMLTDAACVDEINQSSDACASLKQIFLSILVDTKEVDGQKIDKDFTDWNALIDYVKENEQTVLVYTSLISKMNSLFEELGREYYLKQIQEFKSYLTKQQAAEHVVSLNFVYERGYYSDDLVTLDNNSRNNRYNINSQFNYYYGIVLGKGRLNQHGGFITDITRDDAGIKSLEINMDYGGYQINSNDNSGFFMPDIIVKSVMFVIVMLFTVLQLLILSYKLMKNSSRKNKIIEEYKTLYL